MVLNSSTQPRRTRAKYAVVLVTAAIAIVAVGVATAGGQGTELAPNAQAAEFLRLLNPSGAGGIYAYETVQEQAQDADVVVSGRIVDIALGTVIPPNPADGDVADVPIELLDVSIQVDEVVRGDLTRETKTITVQMWKPHLVSLESVKASLPTDAPSLHFLFDGGKLAARRGHADEVVARNSAWYVHQNDSSLFIEDPISGKVLGFDNYESGMISDQYPTFAELLEAGRG